MEKDNLSEEIKLSPEEIESLYQRGKEDYKRIIKMLDPLRLVKKFVDIDRE